MKAMLVMSAQSQQTRFDVFTLLVDALPQGEASGDLATATNTAPSAMSTHLGILSRAGLVKSERIGKSVVYRAVITTIEELTDHLSISFLGRRTGSTSRHSP